MIRIISISFILVLLACSSPSTVHEIENPTSAHSKFPRLFTDTKGAITMSWYEVRGDSALLLASTLSQESWSKPILISSAASTSWFVNWADFPTILSQNGQPIVAHYLRKIPGNKFSYNVELTTAPFQKTVTAHTDSTATEHGFVSMQSTSDSTFYAIWLDGRNTGGSADHSSHGVGDLLTAMTVRGAEFDHDLNKLSESEIDQTACDCCNTALARIPDGLIAAYRNRTADEVRDIYTSRLIDGSWSEGVPVHNDNWEIAACPVNGPALSTVGDMVALLWFTGASDVPKVKLSFSMDAGLNFSTPILLESGHVLGRVDVEMMTDQTAWVSYLNKTQHSTELVLKKISPAGAVLKNLTIPDLDPARATGFPQITKKGDAILIAWTDISSTNPKIKTAVIR